MTRLQAFLVTLFLVASIMELNVEGQFGGTPGFPGGPGTPTTPGFPGGPGTPTTPGVPRSSVPPPKAPTTPGFPGSPPRGGNPPVGGIPRGGLKVGFYALSCPQAEGIIRQTVAAAIASNKRSGAGLIRTHFHDCFVQGCDSSVLIDSTPGNSAEKDGPPNLTLHGFEIIDQAKASIEAVCPGVVSCADILTLAARDSFNLLGGPFYTPRTGRLDGRVSLASQTTDIPSPFDNLAALTASFARKGLSQEQMVTLSGLHTVGKASCGAFTNRLYNFSPTSQSDPTLAASDVASLSAACPPGSETSSIVVDMDPFTPTVADNQYYKNLLATGRLFTSDQALLNSLGTRLQVQQFSSGLGFWGSKAASALIAMSEVGIKTGADGEVRLNCRVIN